MDWLTEFLNWVGSDMRDFRKGIDQGFKDFTRTYGEDIESFFEPLLQFLIWLEKLLLATPWPLFIAIVCVLACRKSQSQNRHRFSSQFISHRFSRMGGHDEYCQYHCCVHPAMYWPAIGILMSRLIGLRRSLPLYSM